MSFAFSEDCVGYRYRFLIIFAVFAVFVLFKLHFSSIGMWDDILKNKTEDYRKTKLAGKARSIRSDEWLVQTPLFMAQCNNEKFFPVKNHNILSSGLNTIISYGAPSFDLTLIAKPFNWGFILFGDERGLSWYWCSRLFLLLILSFEISMLLTKGKILYSVTGAFLIAFSSAVQWWFSTSLVDMIIFSQALVIIADRYFRFHELYKKIILSFLFLICANGFVLTLYPAWMVPMGYLTAVFCLAILYIHWKEGRLHIRYADILIFLFIMLGSVLILYHFYTVSKEDIQSILNTVYPGKRFSSSGGYNLLALQMYVLSWLLPFKDLTFLNNCEISTFTNFMLPVLIVFFRIVKFEKEIRFLIISLFVFYILQLLWLFFHVNDTVARLSFMYFVPAGRLQVISNLTGLYLSIWAISMFLDEKSLAFSEPEKLCVFIILTTVLFSSIFYNKETVDYLRIKGSLVSLVIFLTMNLSLFLKLKKIFLYSVMIYTIVSGLTVNPLSKGLGAIYDKQITQQIIRMNKNDPGKTWAALDSIFHGNLLIALGCKSFNGVNYYPDFEKLARLDPENRYSDVYNRYAHINVKISDSPGVSFKLEQADLYIMSISPDCIKSRTDIHYVVSSENLEKYSGDEIKFVQVYADQKEGLNIYKIN